MTWWLVQHLITVLVVIALIHVATWLLRAGPVVRHALWTILLVKLIVPPVFAWPWQVPVLTAGRSATPHVEIRPLAGIAAQEAAVLPMRQASPSAFGGPDAPAPMQVLNWRAIAIAAWATGGGLFGLIHLVRVRRMRRVLERAGDPPAALEMQAATIARHLRMSPVRIRMAPVSSPFIVGLFRPVLVWPETLPAGIEPAVVPSLLAHEFAHVTRGDCWIGWIELIAGCIWWWNPLFWYVRSQVRANAELACDAWVAHLAPRARRAYAEALLAVSASPTPTPVPMPAVGMRSTNRRLMERRVELIMRAHVPVRLSHTTLCTAAFVAVIVLPAWAQQAVPVPPPAPPASVTSPVQEPQPFERPSPYAGSVVIRRGAQVPQPRTFTEQVIPAQGRPGDVFFFSNNDKLPESAQALMDRFDQSSGQTRRDAEEKIARERTALIEQLQKIQDSETKAGHLDEAVAIRARIRQLQNPPVLRTLRTAIGGGIPRDLEVGDRLFEMEVTPPVRPVTSPTTR